MVESSKLGWVRRSSTKHLSTGTSTAIKGIVVDVACDMVVCLVDLALSFARFHITKQNVWESGLIPPP